MYALVQARAYDGVVPRRACVCVWSGMPQIQHQPLRVARTAGRLSARPPRPGQVISGVLVAPAGGGGTAAQPLLLHPDDLPQYTKLHRGRITQRQVGHHVCTHHTSQTLQISYKCACVCTQALTQLWCVSRPRAPRAHVCAHVSACVCVCVCVCVSPQAIATTLPWSEIRLSLEIMFEGVEGAGTWSVASIEPHTLPHTLPHTQTADNTGAGPSAVAGPSGGEGDKETEGKDVEQPPVKKEKLEGPTGADASASKEQVRLDTHTHTHTHTQGNTHGHPYAQAHARTLHAHIVACKGVVHACFCTVPYRSKRLVSRKPVQMHPHHNKETSSLSSQQTSRRHRRLYSQQQQQHSQQSQRCPLTRPCVWDRW